jgi:hypothetical protein
MPTRSNPGFVVDDVRLASYDLLESLLTPMDEETRMLFAQYGGSTLGRSGDEQVVMFAVFGVALVVGLIISIFYLMTMSKALSLCSPRNRTMEPGMVWLNLIPLLNFVWMFITVSRVSESLKNEFYDRRLPEDPDYGKGLGITFNVLNLLGVIPCIGPVFSLIGLICFIIYWVKIAGFNSKLQAAPDDRDRPRLDDLDEDYRKPFRDRDRAPDRDRNEGDEGYRRRADEDEGIRDR